MDKVSQDLRDVFQAAIDAVAGNRVVAKEMLRKKYVGAFHVIAIGKAADAMVQGVSDHQIIDGLLISKQGHISENLQQDSRFLCLESDHPIPKESSLNAGKALIRYLENLPNNAPCLFLISGGASALVEVLQDNWTLADLTALTDYLLANAYSIDEINAVRRQISKIKGGGLWKYLAHQKVNCLMISDVPNDNPADIGSGLLFPAKDDFLPTLPQEWLNKIKLHKKLKIPGDFNWKIIASLSAAKEAAAIKAKELKYVVKIIPDFLEGEASKVAKNCVESLKEKPNTLLIWGGETTVYLPKNAGQGGRNQHLALAAAIEMNALADSYLLAAGTDGSDGLTAATGAIVNETTVKQGLEKNLIAVDFLSRADSNSFFQDVGGLIETGATGTNVMDLVIAVIKS